MIFYQMEEWRGYGLCFNLGLLIKIQLCPTRHKKKRLEALIKSHETRWRIKSWIWLLFFPPAIAILQDIDQSSGQDSYDRKDDPDDLPALLRKPDEQEDHSGQWHGNAPDERIARRLLLLVLLLIGCFKVDEPAIRAIHDPRRNDQQHSSGSEIK